MLPERVGDVDGVAGEHLHGRIETMRKRNWGRRARRGGLGSEYVLESQSVSQSWKFGFRSYFRWWGPGRLGAWGSRCLGC